LAQHHKDLDTEWNLCTFDIATPTPYAVNNTNYRTGRQMGAALHGHRRHKYKALVEWMQENHV